MYKLKIIAIILFTLLLIECTKDSTKELILGQYNLILEFDSSPVDGGERKYDIVEVNKEYILYKFGVLVADTMYKFNDKVTTTIKDGFHIKYDLKGQIIEKNHIEGTFIYTFNKRGTHITRTGSFNMKLEFKF